jgi:WhiB family redox-sensing transcriptional regulator
VTEITVRRKTCRTCDESKPITEFHPNGTPLRGACKSCHREAHAIASRNRLAQSRGQHGDHLDHSWRNRARCNGDSTDTFYPPFGASVPDIQKPKKICAKCPVKPECLAYALAIGDPYGIWGGLTAGERAELQRKRRAVA